MIILYYTLLFLFLFLCLILCGVILMQESKSSGLGATFGGDAGDSLFGTSTPEVLKTITAYLSAFFLAGCIILSLWTSTMSRVKSKPHVATERFET